MLAPVLSPAFLALLGWKKAPLPPPPAADGPFFMPLQAVIGGLFIGVAAAGFMILANRICGHSGIIKTVVAGRPQWATSTFLLGLLYGGRLISQRLPLSFESVAEPCLKLLLGGFLVGAGVTLSNGCTSGHGLCGVSRLSRRSFVAVPMFMVCASLSASAGKGFAIGRPLQVGETPAETVELAKTLAVAFAAAFVAGLMLTAPFTLLRDVVAGLWAGSCSAVGFGIGGMSKPSVVLGALSPAAFDPTLWLLFIVALSSTFVGYRIAELLGGAGRYPTRARGGQIDAQLLSGAALFGIGWGVIGMCPGPHMAALGAMPESSGHWCALVGVAVGMRSTLAVL